MYLVSPNAHEFIPPQQAIRNASQSASPGCQREMLYICAVQDNFIFPGSQQHFAAIVTRAVAENWPWCFSALVAIWFFASRVYETETMTCLHFACVCGPRADARQLTHTCNFLFCSDEHTAKVERTHMCGEIWAVMASQGLGQPEITLPSRYICRAEQQAGEVEREARTQHTPTKMETGSAYTDSKK